MDKEKIIYSSSLKYLCENNGIDPFIWSKFLDYRRKLKFLSLEMTTVVIDLGMLTVDHALSRKFWNIPELNSLSILM